MFNYKFLSHSGAKKLEMLLTRINYFCFCSKINLESCLPEISNILQQKLQFIFLPFKMLQISRKSLKSFIYFSLQPDSSWWSCRWWPRWRRWWRLWGRLPRALQVRICHLGILFEVKTILYQIWYQNKVFNPI